MLPVSVDNLKDFVYFQNDIPALEELVFIGLYSIQVDIMSFVFL